MHGNYQNRSKDVVLKTDMVPKEEEAVQPDAPKVDIVGNVVGCTSLNMRENPDRSAPIITVIPAGTEVVIDMEQSISEFYKVSNAAGIEGYCMKQYIQICS